MINFKIIVDIEIIEAYIINEIECNVHAVRSYRIFETLMGIRSSAKRTGTYSFSMVGN